MNIRCKGMERWIGVDDERRSVYVITCANDWLDRVDRGHQISSPVTCLVAAVVLEKLYVCKFLIPHAFLKFLGIYIG